MTLANKLMYFIVVCGFQLFFIGICQAKETALTRMLEQKIPAIVTVSILNTTPLQKIYGFASTDVVNKAYNNRLDLSGGVGSGSGFVIVHKNKKYVVTNAHVIDKVEKDDGIDVYDIDLTKHKMHIVGADSFYDVAVLGFEKDPGSALQSISFRKDAPRLGENVYAVGNPLGEFPFTVSDGIVGALNRVRGFDVGVPGYIQSTATITWGNSGGPLLDADGNVLGINTQIHISDNMGGIVHPQLNFALESRIVKRLVEEIIEKGRINRSHLGIVFVQETKNVLFDAIKPPEIALLVPGSPAAAALAGMEQRAITAVNGIPVKSLGQIFIELEKISAGERVTFQFGNNIMEKTFTTGELDRTARTSNVRAILRSMASIDVAIFDGVVTIFKARCDEPGQASCGRRAFVGTSDDEELTDNIPEDFALQVEAAGDGKNRYRVETIEDVEAIVKKGSLMGSFSFVSISDDEKPIWVKFDKKSKKFKAMVY